MGRLLPGPLRDPRVCVAEDARDHFEIVQGERVRTLPRTVHCFVGTGDGHIVEQAFSPSCFHTLAVMVLHMNFSTCCTFDGCV